MIQINNLFKNLFETKQMLDPFVTKLQIKFTEINLIPL